VLARFARGEFKLIRPHLGESLPSLRHLQAMADGARVQVPGMVVCRQQPGTAKGFVFLLLEDEFGMVNVIVPPWLHERQRALVRGEARHGGRVAAGTISGGRFAVLPVPHRCRRNHPDFG
jgi:hypothetical protein